MINFNEPLLIRFAFAKANQNGRGELTLDIQTVSQLVAAGFSLRYIAQPEGCGYQILGLMRIMTQSDSRYEIGRLSRVEEKVK